MYIHIKFSNFSFIDLLIELYGGYYLIKNLYNYYND